MATVTDVSDLSKTPEQMEKQVLEEQESVSPPKESGEEEKPKVGALSNAEVAVPLVTELEEKIENKQVEPPVLEDLKKIDEEEKPKARVSPSPVVPLVELEEKIENKQIEPPLLEDVKMANEEEKPKVEARVSPSPVVPLVELEEKIENKQIEPPVLEDVKMANEEQKSKVGFSTSPVVPLFEPEVKIEDKQVEPPAIEEVKKTDDSPIVVVPVEDTKFFEKDSIPEPSTPSVSEPVTDHVKSEPEEIPMVEKVEKKHEQSTLKTVEEKPVEPTKVVDVSESSVEAFEKKEQIENLPVKVSEEGAVHHVENIEAKSEKEDIPELVFEAEKPPQVTEKVEEESEAVKPKESVQTDIGKTEEVADEVEHTKLVEEEPTTEEKHLMTENIDQISSINQESQFNPEGVDKVECCADDLAEKGSVVDKEKELVGEADVIDGLTKKEVIEVVKFEAENVKTEENEEKTVPTGELTQPARNDTEDVTSSISATEVTEKTLEGENTSRDIELVAENGKENVKDETVASVDGMKDQEVEKKVDEVTKTTAKEPLEEPQKSDVEVKGEESVQTSETKLEKEKQGDEIATHDVSVPEPNKDGDDLKTLQEPPKEEVSAKSSQKQSKNFLSKMKHSLVKAKKAIVGKSPNSKTPSSETKGDVEAK